jgi:DNA-3-methyladenine glycosylase II
LRTTEDHERDFRLRTRLTIDSSDIAAPYDFGFQLRHYVVHPEVRDGQQLVAIVRLTSGQLVKIDIRSLGTLDEPQLELNLYSAEPITPPEVAEARRLVVWRLGLEDELRPFYALAADDPILGASIEHNFGGKSKASFSMFDAVIDVICAQNTAFRRLYAMRANLGAAFGDPVVTNGRVYHASPTPAQLAAAPREAIRGCGVGYRDRYIKGVAEAVVRGLDVESLRGMPRNEARDDLMKLPGVGPYTADLGLIIGARRQDAMFIDVFLREVLRTFYFDGKPVSENSQTAIGSAAIARQPRHPFPQAEQHGGIGGEQQGRSDQSQHWEDPGHQSGAVQQQHGVDNWNKALSEVERPVVVGDQRLAGDQRIRSGSGLAQSNHRKQAHDANHDGGGFQLGIKERVAIRGGSVEYGGGERGGFGLRAVLPMP